MRQLERSVTSKRSNRTTCAGPSDEARDDQAWRGRSERFGVDGLEHEVAVDDQFQSVDAVGDGTGRFERDRLGAEHHGVGGCERLDRCIAEGSLADRGARPAELEVVPLRAAADLLVRAFEPDGVDPFGGELRGDRDGVELATRSRSGCRPLGCRTGRPASPTRAGRLRSAGTDLPTRAGRRRTRRGMGARRVAKQAPGSSVPA